MALTEQARQVYARLFGEEPKGDGPDPELMEILQNFIFGEVFSTGVLDDIRRERITVAVLAAMQTMPQLKAHGLAALRVGNTPLELRETIYLCAPMLGFPKTLNAIAAVNEVFAAQGVALPLPDAGATAYPARLAEGAAVQMLLYGDEIKQNFASLPGEFGQRVPEFLTGLCFGDFYTRSVLDVKERELLILCVLAALGAEAQLKAHVLGAYRAGNSVLELTAALTQALPYIGFPYALNALRHVLALEG